MGPLLKGLRYPLQTVPLLFIGTYTVLMSFVIWQAAQGLIGFVAVLPLTLILVSWLLKYAFAMFDAIARGLREPPVLSYEMVNPLGEQRPLGQAMIVLVYYVASGWTEPLWGARGVGFLRIIGCVLLPASVATLGITGHLLQAANPRVLVPLMHRLGWHYVPVLACAAVFGLAIEWLIANGGIRLTSHVPLAVAATVYGWLAMFCVLAAVLYERRTELGLETWFSPEQAHARATARSDRARDRVVDEFYSHWRSGSYANAWTAVERHIAAAGNPADEYLWIHERAGRWPDGRFAARIARELIPLLIQQRRNSDALAVTRARLAADRTFRPTSGAELVRLVHIARDIADHATARTLLVDFERYFPGDRAQPIVEALRAELSRGR